MVLICMRPDSHIQLPTKDLRPFSILFLFCFLGGVAFSEFSIAYYRFRFCMEGTLYVLLPDRCFIPCNHGLEFDVRLGQNSVNQSNNQSKQLQQG